MSKIREVADEFKRNNGNVNITQKEMLIYIVNRIDKIDDKMNDGAGKIAANREAVNGLKKLVYTIGSIALSGFIFIIGLIVKNGGK